MKQKISIIMFVGIIGCIGSLTSCTSKQIPDSSESRSTSIPFDRTIHFGNASGATTQVQPGTYEMNSSQGKLQLTGGSSGLPILLDARVTTHEETVETTTPLSFSEQEDEHIVMLLFPDGTALEAMGSYSGIQSRAARRSGKRVSRAVIKRQFKQRKRIPHVIPYHFTFRVPVQLHNLSPDINQLKIRCHTFSGNDATKPDKRIGEGKTIVNLTTQQFSGTVVVAFNAMQGKEPENGDYYHCGMQFHKPGIGFRQPLSYGHPAANSAPAWSVAANETAFIRNILAPVN